MNRPTVSRSRHVRGGFTDTPLSRRRLLLAAAGIGVTGLAAGARVVPHLFAQTPVEGLPLVEPEVRASRDGLLQTTLECATSEVTIGGRTVSSMVYERSFPGPTLRLRPGDTLKIKLVNHLDEHTNLHTHGFHVSPANNSDNVLLHIEPGETFEYEYRIPTDHPAGFNWYHPHFHGLTAEQVFGGMAGGAIFVGDLDELPEIAGLRERTLILQASQHDQRGRAIEPSASRVQNRFFRFVNGQLHPTIEIHPGETQRWRLLNATPNVFYRLHLEGHTVHEIATDGNTLDRPYPRDEILLSPGERTEVLVQARTPGRFALRSLEFDGGFSMQPDTVLATMVTTGAAQTPRPLPQKLLPFEDLRPLPLDKKRTITFQIMSLDRFAPAVPMAAFMVDNKLFDEIRVDQLMDLGAVEEWTVRNASNNWHPFHVHVNDFLVTHVDGQTVPVRGYKDTFPLAPFSSFTMRTRFADFTGKFVFHCHILQHEDGGMMQVVEVK